jgi:hypothetical protein
MAMYVIVHHPSDADQPYRNEWDGDQLVAITTRSDLGKRCREAMTAGERVYVYRCAWSAEPATICCSARVAVAELIPGGAFVRFTDGIPLAGCPPYPASKGQICYEAPAP